MSKYSAENKLRMVKLVLEDKYSITSIATDEGVPQSTLMDWIRN